MQIRIGAACAGTLVLLGACGRSVEGKWCPEGETGFVELKGGKATVSDGARTQTGTYTFNGTDVTATPDDGGPASTLSFGDDGKLHFPSPPMTFARCS
jgi:hypothetical protein